MIKARCSDIKNIVYTFDRKTVGHLLGWLLFLGLGGSASAQVVENVKVELARGTRDAVVTYNLLSPTPNEFRVSLLYSMDFGASFVPAPITVAGDVGSTVPRGNDKRIIWSDFVSQMQWYRGEQIIFRVVAQPGEDFFMVQFKDEITTALEGQGSVGLKLVSSNPFFGTVQYRVSDLTNVAMMPSTSPDVTSVSGVIEMAGSEAEIPVSIFDDFNVEEPKALTLDLVYDAALGYMPGKQFRTMLVLYDDDGYWNGVMKGFRSADGELPYRMLVARKDGQVSGTLVSGGTAQESGGIPPGSWTLSMDWDGTVFTAESVPLPIDVSSLFPQSKDLSRRVLFVADVRTTGSMVRINSVIMGRYSEAVTGESGADYLGSNTLGGFVMLKEVVPFVPPEPKISPIPESGFVTRPSSSDAILDMNTGAGK